MKTGCQKVLRILLHGSICIYSRATLHIASAVLQHTTRAAHNCVQGVRKSDVFGCMVTHVYADTLHTCSTPAVPVGCAGTLVVRRGCREWSCRALLRFRGEEVSAHNCFPLPRPQLPTEEVLVAVSFRKLLWVAVGCSGLQWVAVGATVYMTRDFRHCVCTKLRSFAKTSDAN